MATVHIPANAERGAEFLDEKLGPDWDEQINLRSLDLGSTCNCVVGQLYKEHSRDFRAFSRGVQDLAPDVSAGKLGFTTWGMQTYYSLTLGWKALIKKRRRARRSS